jgi:predicted RNase H-like HicB family nuclease
MGNINSVNNRTFRVVITRSQENDCYIANIPSLTYCMAHGDTVEEAMANLQEALEGTLEVMMEDNIQIPDDSKNMEMTITVPIKSSLLYA